MAFPCLFLDFGFGWCHICSYDSGWWLFHVCFWILVLAGVIFVLMTVAGGFSMFVFVH